MIVYYSTLMIVSVLLMLYSSRRLSKAANSFFYFCITVVLLFVAGFRYYVGTDYGSYIRNYTTYQVNSLSMFSQPALRLVARWSAFVYDDYATWFFLMSAITVLPVMKTISKESSCVWLSVILYLFLGCWHSSFNTIKQSAAATILFTGYPLLRDRKFWKWCVICLIASGFHVSAFFMIPVYFLLGTKRTSIQTMLIVVVGMIVLFSYDSLFALMGILKQGENTLSAVEKGWLNDVNFLRILVHCAPVLLYFLFHKKFDKQDAAFSGLYHMSLLNAMLNIGSMNSVYLNRFCSYTNIFNILFIPMLFQPIKRKRATFWILPLALLCYFAFWSYDLYKDPNTVVFRWIFER